MFKKATLLLCLLYSCHMVPLATAQMTTVSGTVTDSDGTLWTYGTITVSFVPNPSNPNPANYRINGAAMNAAVLNQGPISLGSSGTFSVSVYDNTQVTPIGSQWLYTLCPNASTSCGTVTVGASGTSQVLTPTITASIHAPRFKPIPGTYGYNDAEASLLLSPGSTYWNVTLGQQRFWNSISAAWVTGAGVVGGSVTNFAAPAGSWPTWFVPSVSNPSTTPSLSITASAIPASALVGNGCITLGGTAACLNQTVSAVTGLTVDGATPTNIASLDTTTSIATQLAQRVNTNNISPQSIVSSLAAPEYISPLFLAPAALPAIMQPGAGSTTSACILDPSGTICLLNVDAVGNWMNRTGQTIIPDTAEQYFGVASGGPLLVNAAPSGTGAPCLVNGCALVNATSTTQSTSDNSNLNATDAFVHAYVSSISSGVTSLLDSTSTPFTGNIQIPALTCTAGSPAVCALTLTGIPNITLTIPSITVPANSCFGTALNTPGTRSMPGVLAAVSPSLVSTTAVWPTYNANPSALVGWGSSGGLSPKVWADPGGNQVDWIVCNPTSASIISNSLTLNVSAQ